MNFIYDSLIEVAHPIGGNKCKSVSGTGKHARQSARRIRIAALIDDRDKTFSERSHRKIEMQQGLQSFDDKG